MPQGVRVTGTRPQAPAARLSRFLESTTVVDWAHPAVRQLADQLAIRGDIVGTARRMYDYVRDEIRHTQDFHLTVVTCAASEVVAARSGFCYAKSHLLAALLRAAGIPCGFCYQRLAQGDEGRYCLHGLNAVWLPEIGWYRLDARGNKPGVDARFEPPVEHLAWPITRVGEATLPEVWADPLPLVVEALRAHTDARTLARNLPDLDLRGS